MEKGRQKLCQIINLYHDGSADTSCSCAERQVKTLVIYANSAYGKTGYYLCPRCSVTLEREFAAFCDRCGQKLGWKNYKKVKVIRKKCYVPPEEEELFAAPLT